MIGSNFLDISIEGSRPLFHFSGGNLYIATDWVLKSKNQSLSPKTSIDNVLEMEIRNLLEGKNIIDMSVKGKYYDLRITFSENSILQTNLNLLEYNPALPYDQWIFSRAPNDMIVAGPGNSWSLWIPEGENIQHK